MQVTEGEKSDQFAPKNIHFVEVTTILGYVFFLSFQEDRRGGANNEGNESQKLEELGATVRLETG